MMRVNPCIPIWIFLLLFIACRSQKKDAGVIHDETPKENVILFMVYHIQHDTLTNKTSLKFISSTKANGSLKKETLYETSGANTLIVEVYEKKKLISTQKLEHPLYKEVEVAEGTSLSRKAVTLKEADFFFRIQKPAEDAEVKIKESVHHENPVELITQTL